MWQTPFLKVNGKYIGSNRALTVQTKDISSLATSKATQKHIQEQLKMCKINGECNKGPRDSLYTPVRRTLLPNIY